MLQQALAMSLESGLAGSRSGSAKPDTAGSAPKVPVPDFSTMTEEEQIAYAMQISMQECRKSDILLFLY